MRIDDFKYRFTDQANGWLGATEKVDWPILVNLRLDTYERTGMPDGKGGSITYYNWFAYEFSLAKRAEATYTEYSRQKASASGERGFRLPLC